jgi:hypothetical protein
MPKHTIECFYFITSYFQRIILAFIKETQKPDIFTLERTFLSKLIHFDNVNYLEGVAVSQSSRRFRKEIECDKPNGKVLERIRKILLNVDLYGISVVGMVILCRVNEKKGMEEKQKPVI